MGTLNVNSLSHYFNIIFYQTKVALQQESKRYFLGMLWWLFEPLIHISVFLILVAAGLRFGSRDPVPFIAAITLWKFYGGTMGSVSGSITGSRGLMNQVSLPNWIFPLQSAAISFSKFSFVLLVLFLYLWGAGAPFSIHYLSFFYVMGVFVLLTLAFSFLVASIVPFLPDLKLIIGNLTMFLFFTSGVFIDIRSFDPQIQEYFFTFNPFAVIMVSFKDLLTAYTWPMWNRLSIIAVVSGLVLTLALRLMHRFRYIYPKLTRG